MRKVKLGMIFAAVAMLAVGCSNLWDYVPPVRKPSKTTPPPPSKTEPPVDETPPSADGPSSSGPSSPSGPSYTPPASPPKVLTFYVDDGSGTLKEVKVKTNNKTATAAEIIAAYTGNPTAPNGFEFEIDGGKITWYKSDTVNKLVDGSYSPGEKFVLGLKPKTGGTTNGYAITTAPTSSKDTGRDFVTTPTSEGSKTLEDVLLAAGIVDSTDPKLPPKNIPSGWEFDHWADPTKPNPSDPSNKIDPATTLASGDKITAVYKVDYKIEIGANTYTVKVPVVAPNDGATLEDILKAAANDSSVPENDVNKLKEMLWNVGSTVADTASTKRYPAGTAFTGTNAISFNVGGTIVKVADPDGDDKATWAEIKTAAIAQGVNLTPSAPAGTKATFKGWQKIGETSIAQDTDSFSAGTFNSMFEVTYTINDGGSGSSSNHMTTEVVPATDMGKTLKQIFDTIGVDVEGHSITDPNLPSGKTGLTIPLGKAFDGWIVTKPNGDKVVVKTSEIKNGTGAAAGNFPWGTTIEPNWIDQYVAKIHGVDIEFTEFDEGIVDGGIFNMTPVDGLYMANTEITLGQWKAVMSKNGLGNEWYARDGQNQWNNALATPTTADGSERMQMPMNWVSWYDVIVFCNMLSILNNKAPYYYLDGIDSRDPRDWGEQPEPKYQGGSGSYSYNEKWDNIKTDENANGYRLPTEAQWQFAAQGGKDMLYKKYSGTTADVYTEVAWGPLSATGVRPVATTPSSDYPVRDMSGNVWEWCWDRKTQSDASQLIYRGGAWDCVDAYQVCLLITHRPGQNGINAGSDNPNYRSKGIGFRVVLPQ